MAPSNTLVDQLKYSFISHSTLSSQSRPSGGVPNVNHPDPRPQNEFRHCSPFINIADGCHQYGEKYFHGNEGHKNLPYLPEYYPNSMDEWRSSRLPNHTFDFPCDFSTGKNSSTESECSSSYPSPVVSHEEKPPTRYSERSSSTSPKVSDIHKLLNQEGNKTEKNAVLPPCTKSTPEETPACPSFSLEHLPSNMTKAQYHLYLDSSRDLYHPRAVSFIPNPVVQGHYCHENYRSYAYPQGSHYSSLASVKNHVCQYPGCYTRFKRLEHLKRHFRVHTLERPYACTHKGCEKTFSRRDNLGQHLKTHERRIQRQEQLRLNS